MKFRTPVRLPQKNAGKYGEVHQRVAALKVGMWLPITFKTRKEIFSAYNTLKSSGLSVRKSGDVLYCQLKTAKKATS